MTALRLVFGIDPGQTGAIAVMADGVLEAFIDMPILTRPSGGNEIDGAALASALRDERARHPGADVQVVMEQVNAMPSIPGADGVRRSMGSSSAFHFGESFGIVKGVIAALGLPLILVHSLTWKRHFGLLKKKKDAARILAIQKHPRAAASLARKMDVGRADALLIASWAHRTEQVGNPVRRAERRNVA